MAAIRQSELNIDQGVRLTVAHAETGQGPPADANRAVSEALLFHQDEERAEGDVAVAAARLSELLNLDPSVRLHPRLPRSAPSFSVCRRCLHKRVAVIDGQAAAVP